LSSELLRNRVAGRGGVRFLRTLYWGLLTLFLVILSSVSLMSKDSELFTASFVTGARTGDLDLTYKECAIEQEGTSGVSHLLMNKPGKSIINGSFTLSKVPKKLYFQINNCPSKLGSQITGAEENRACYTLYINDKQRESLLRGNELYLINGYEISKFCVAGTNTFSLVLEEKTGADLWVRQLYITPVGSFAEKAQAQEKRESFFLHIPLYVAFFLVITITISYLLFIILWKNRVGPGTATAVALVACGIGFISLPFMVFEGLSLSLFLVISVVGAVGGIIWILAMHR